MKINNAAELSNFVKSQRKKNLRSQVDVSAKVGIQQPTLSAFEKSSHHSRVETLLKIVYELGLEFHLVEKDEHLPGADDWQEEW
jgi:transcriptional regulator with XRE-family HTH domain